MEFCKFLTIPDTGKANMEGGWKDTGSGQRMSLLSHDEITISCWHGPPDEVGEMEKLLKEIKEEYDREGTRFELIKKGDRFIRLGYYSDSSGETYEKEKGYTDDDERYSGSFGAYERFKKKSSIEPYDWNSDIRRALLDKYYAHRTPSNFFTAWFYWYLTGAVLIEIWDSIEISHEYHEFFRIDPDIVLPKTKNTMESRCIEGSSLIVKTHESYDDYFHGYYNNDSVFEDACSCDDGKLMTRTDEVSEELMSISLVDLKKILKLSSKDAITARQNELKDSESG